MNQFSKGSRIIYQRDTPYERKGKVLGVYKENYGRKTQLDVSWEPNPNFEGKRYFVLAELCTLATA